MIKVSELRSAVRRVVLTKSADEYSDIMNGYANSYRGGIPGAGVRTAVNRNLRASGYEAGTSASPAPTAKKAPEKPGFRITNPFTAKGGLISDTKNLFRTLSGKIRGKSAPRPVVGATAPIVSR